MNGIKWLLDTNMVIGLLKAYAPAVALAEAQGLDLEHSSVSQITRMELLGFPGLTTEEEMTIQDFLGSCRVILLDEMIEHKAIELRRSGHFKLPDAIVAASAITCGLRLLTLDRRLLEAFGKLGFPL